MGRGLQAEIPSESVEFAPLTFATSMLTFPASPLGHGALTESLHCDALHKSY